MADEDTAQAVEEQTKQEQGDSKTQVQSAEFPEATGPEGAGASASIDMLLDLNVPVTVAVGKIDMSVQRVLQLGPGSVVKLDKSIDAPADLYIMDNKFASGNVVVVEGKFAVRITEIVGAGVPEGTEN